MRRLGKIRLTADDLRRILACDCGAIGETSVLEHVRALSSTKPALATYNFN